MPTESTNPAPVVSSRKARIVSAFTLVVALGSLSGCIVIDDSAVRSSGSVMDEHYTIEADGRKVPWKDVRTETSQKADGTIVIKRDETYHGEGSKLADELFDGKSDGK